MYRSILVPLDGSRLAEWALPAAISIARRQSAQLELIMIEQVKPVAAGFAATDSEADARREPKNDALGYLTRIAERVRAVCSLSVKLSVQRDRVGIANEIVHYAYDNGTDLIVMATHGAGLFKRFWLGSVADAVIRRSRIATLLVRPRADAEVDLKVEPQFRNILVPLDGSSDAEDIIDHAIAVGGTDAHYTLFHSLPLMPVYSSEFAVVAAAGTDEEIRRAQHEAAQVMLDGVTERIGHRVSGIRVATVVSNDDFAAGAVLGYAERNPTDLIALTTHGHGAAVRLMLGSVADKVTRGAEVPVLLYRPVIALP
jgi:nucleotide-binding universal stress UspA family protein